MRTLPFGIVILRLELEPVRVLSSGSGLRRGHQEAYHIKVGVLKVPTYTENSASTSEPAARDAPFACIRIYIYGRALISEACNKPANACVTHRHPKLARNVVLVTGVVPQAVYSATRGRSYSDPACADVRRRVLTRCLQDTLTLGRYVK